MRWAAALLGLGAVAATPFAGLAQLSEPGRQSEPENAVIVTGTRDRDRAVRDFVELVTIESRGQIARFATPVCPAVLGLPAGHSEFIADRIRQIADYVGIEAAAEGCAPNVVIVVAERGGDFVGRLHAERPELFRAMELVDIRRAMQLAGPARAWQVLELRGADGRSLHLIEVGRERRLRPALSGVMPSLTSRPTRQDLSLSFVVFDLPAVDGLTLLQIADHAAMRALARTRAPRLPSGRSILTLFADREAGASTAAELTDWDAAYLRALYRGSGALTAQLQRSSVAGAMRRDLETEP